MEFKDIRSKIEFKDISTEWVRIYAFGPAQYITIQEPIGLNVSKNGHRIVDAAENSHYIPKGWIHLMWKVKKGEPHFVL